MAQLAKTDSVGTNERAEREKALKILAKSLYKELRSSGYHTRDLVAFSSELIDLITTDIKPVATTTAATK